MEGEGKGGFTSRKNIPGKLPTFFLVIVQAHGSCSSQIAGLCGSHFCPPHGSGGGRGGGEEDRACRT